MVENLEDTTLLAPPLQGVGIQAMREQLFFTFPSFAIRPLSPAQVAEEDYGEGRSRGRRTISHIAACSPYSACFFARSFDQLFLGPALPHLSLASRG